ncbi:AAA-domain-containing protein [Xylariaceae sp. FL0255]|nr:AAA-domain-containing protein [Xylariaceae sp. FL0255]
MAPRKNAASTAAEVSLVTNLKSCLVHIPASLVNVLVNSNTIVQNVVVELNYRSSVLSDGSGQPNPSSAQQSIFVGWSGMSSKRKLAPLVDRDGITNGRDREVPSVEIDVTLASTLGLTEGQKVMVVIHVDPPVAHTVNIEPLTPEDWEIIELHATFLELNMLQQIRAVPNPAYAPGQGAPLPPHALTLHLSPTSTANIKVLSLAPVSPADVPFVKIAQDTEVIVAPKIRTQPSKSSRENRSVGGTSRRSGKSAASTVRRKTAREEKKPALFLRAIEKSFCSEWFDEGPLLQDLSVWIDRDLLSSKDFRGVNYVTVNIIRPASLQPIVDPQQQQQREAAPPEAAKPTQKIVAHLRPWDDPPSSQTVALSRPLCASLGCPGIVGGVAKIEPAPQPTSRNSPDKIKVFPFVDQNSRSISGLKFGGETKAEKEESSKRISHIYNAKESGVGLLNGPLTDGMVLGVFDGVELQHGWEGGVLKFDTPSSQDAKRWYLPSDRTPLIDVQPPIPRPSWLDEDVADEGIPTSNQSTLVGMDPLLGSLKSHLSHISSVLLTGALGSGKTSVAQSLAQTLRKEFLFHTTYFACRKLVNDESRISTIKENLNRIFMAASWGARLGGKAVVILDDLDKLCPVETELQVGNDNGRSRQVSETICAIVRQYCGRDSGVVLLATAQGKDSLNNVIIGGHVVREIIDLKAPDKEGRRRVLERIVRENTVSPTLNQMNRSSTTDGSRPTTANGSVSEEGGAWMDGDSQPSRSNSISKSRVDGFLLDPDLDFLDLAGETDGYMPGDLILLVSRAHNEALIRSVSESSSKQALDIVQLSRADFDSALKGFTPASLRNVTLQTSTTTFDSIGGLTETRQILLETLQYPTKYAPIFAQCPLRLRSGLLLYGYPGCGKTLLASAVAGECGLNFISVKGPEILNKYIGASEKSVRDLFERASAAKPCVLFFDEFDSIAPKRGHDSTGVTDRVVNQLLTQMDGAEGLSGVYVLAATSRPDLIDPALLRPGRLDKSLLCDFPNLEDRVDILRALGKKVKLSEEISSSEEVLVELGKRTDGFSGADLQALMSNAQLEAIHDVLNDLELQPSGGKRNDGIPRDKKATIGGARNFIQFRYGTDASLAEINDRATKGHNRSAEVAENAAIAAKLAEIKMARRRARMGTKPIGSADDDHGHKAKTGKDTEVRIGWKHMVKALEGTRASISSQERSRLERIYREFVVGRSGEMRDGQGSMEIGGRSSLM